MGICSCAVVDCVHECFAAAARGVTYALALQTSLQRTVQAQYPVLWVGLKLPMCPISKAHHCNGWAYPPSILPGAALCYLFNNNVHS
jgi:hypothetical protein